MNPLEQKRLFTLKLTQEDMDAIHQEEVETIMPSIGVNKALGHLGLMQEVKDSKLGDPRLFWYLRWNVNRTLTHPIVREHIVAAISRNDEQFFVELGRLLSKAPVAKEEIKNNITSLEGFLLRNWCRPDDDLQYSLCYYSDPALLKFLSFIRKFPPYTNFPALSPDTLEMAWRRLELKKASRRLFGDVRVERGLMYPIPFKKFRQRIAT